MSFRPVWLVWREETDREVGWSQGWVLLSLIYDQGCDCAWGPELR